MSGPADRSAAAAGIEGPHEWTAFTLELRGTWGLDVIAVVLVDGVEMGRAQLTPSMVAEFTATSGEPSTTMVRLMRAAQ